MGFNLVFDKKEKKKGGGGALFTTCPLFRCYRGLCSSLMCFGYVLCQENLFVVDKPRWVFRLR